MRNGLTAFIVTFAIAISVGALLMSWEYGPHDSRIGSAMQEGRAALSTDPERPLHPAEQP